MYLVYKHRRIDTHPAKNRPYTATACKACLHTAQTDSHFTCTLCSSCRNASWRYGWMDSWFETCLWSPLRQGMGSDGFMCHDMLYWHTALLSHPGSSLACTAHFNPIYSKLTTLYDSHISTWSLSLLILLFFSVSVCRLYLLLCLCLPRASSSSSHFLPHLSLHSIAPGKDLVQPLLPGGVLAV